ncbi:hypothetical protein [Alteromonas lipolytica]|uniref:HhH-GPD domain-containing protein n=1 Tax=Alteromonas lipolytica TaxID=1856405 RepID=A0A1E8FA51_9ALTE|nr:hypothetical protein [Alteromonas lipolytica]OFI32789.1 hypothetical protein BFC17_06480 [Alteromonas lipolytica]GGF72980.1 hypothetical protein GCM10011338_26480 [Alteromonas lipolytica]
MKGRKINIKEINYKYLSDCWIHSERLSKLFDFLTEKQNQQHVDRLHEKALKHALTAYENPMDKVISLVYGLLAERSSGNIKYTAEFIQALHNKEGFYNFDSFVKRLEESGIGFESYEKLYQSLQRFNGVGKKTAALLVKTLYQINISRGKEWELAFWPENSGYGMKKIANDDRLYLPVDAVIHNVFFFNNTIQDPVLYKSASRSFDTINDFLFTNSSENYPEKMLIWDDIWFWGYITQFSGKNVGVSGRRIASKEEAFNREKYWANPYTAKTNDEIKDIERACREFIEIVG